MRNRTTIPAASIAMITTLLLCLVAGWAMILTEIQAQVRMIRRTYQETQLTLLRSSAAMVAGYTSIRNPHRIEVESGWYEREIFSRFISGLRIFEASQPWLYSGVTFNINDHSAYPIYTGMHGVPVTGMAPANTMEPYFDVILEQVATSAEGMGSYDRPNYEGEVIISWTPVEIGGQVWTLGMTTPMETILSATGTQSHHTGLLWQIGIITMLSFGVVVAWGHEVVQRSRVTRQLQETNEELENRVARRTRDLSEVNLDLKREISKQQETETALNRQIQRFEQLHKIDTLISAGVDIHVTVHYMIEQALAQSGVDAVAVYLPMNGGGKLKLVDGLGFHANIDSFPIINSSECWAGAAAFSGDLLFYPSLARHPRSWCIPRHLRNEGFVSYLAMPLKAKGEVKGVCEIYSRSGLEDSLEWISFLEMVAGSVAIAIDNSALMEKLHQKNVELSSAYDATLEGWSRAIELHDRESEGHSQRVVELTVQLARRMRLPEENIIHIRRGALLHDIGKMGIPDAVLQKTGPLNGEERKQIQMHPEYAYRMLLPVDYLAPAMEIPYCHHERWDGKGYPRGLKGEEIPMAARVFSVIDVWDALRSDRPYRRAWQFIEARDYILAQAGSQFDPVVVEAFQEMLEENADLVAAQIWGNPRTVNQNYS